MLTFSPGTAVTVTIPLVDANGDAVAPVGARAFLYGEDDEILAGPFTPTITAGAESVEITIPGADNALPAGESVGYRAVTLTMDMGPGAGEIPTTVEYLIRAERRLELLKNTFQSYGAAMILSEDMPMLLGWEDASKLDRTAALIEAHDRLCRLAYRAIDDRETINWQSRLNWREPAIIIRPSAWVVMTADEFNALPARFLKALRKAQIAEADSMLGGDPVSEKRRSGILSERIGESEMTFRAGTPPKAGACEAALEYIARYVDRRQVITRG